VVKESEMAQWLVSPEIYVKKIEDEMAPKIAAIMGKTL
jgi:hypothetical protein